ncbi:NADH:ubiquinone oxidoreductase [Coemansia sp. RSA 552]|nr:NADH:ubiquinone oxidoreductase [Coemansia sp. RSA 552]
MSEEEPASFATAQEEAEYWRSVAYEMRDRLDRKELELAEFVAQSSELEAELEKEIERVEKTNKELRARNEKYRFDMEELKEKYQKAQLKAGEDLVSIERELQFVRSQQEYYQSRTRELEQDNDDLERNGRAAQSSLQAMETRLGRAIEERSQLMGEVETKKLLVDEVQRLKDELKDLNLELNIVRSRNTRAGTASGLSKSSANVADNGETPVRMIHNIMTRAKDLESRLAGARSMVNPMIGSSGHYATIHAHMRRNRTVSTPKSSSALFASGPSTNDGSALQRPTNLRSLNSTSDEPRVPESSLMERRKRDMSRKMHDSFGRRRTLDEGAQRPPPQQQPISQRGQAL